MFILIKIVYLNKLLKSLIKINCCSWLCSEDSKPSAVINLCFSLPFPPGGGGQVARCHQGCSVWFSGWQGGENGNSGAPLVTLCVMCEEEHSYLKFKLAFPSWHCVL